MSREALVFLLGLILVALPSLGIPVVWKTWGLYIVGVLLIWCGYSLRRSAYLREIQDEFGELSTDSFSESRRVSPTSEIRDTDQ